MTHLFIDAEYAFTCAMREGMIPNYRAITDLFKKRHAALTMYAYFVGDKKKKKAISEFLHYIGIPYITIMDIEHISKAQVIGSQIAIDTVRFITSGVDAEYAFLSGDDYLIPLIEYISKYNMKPTVYYFPIIVSKELEKSLHCKLHKLTDGFFTFPKDKL